jgi:polysaccharide export outer membrane protein
MICVLCACFGAPAWADEYRLAADTKIQITIVQWNPSKGEYQRWDALGGAYQVSPEGTIGLPVIGSLHVSDNTSAEVAAHISAGLREKLGLISAPDVTVEIAQYPAIYVVGAVTTPGAYVFRPNLTVLQALAIAGGRYRPNADRQMPDSISLNGELATIRIENLRLLGRIARLQAEVAGDVEVHFPPELTSDSHSALVSEVVTLENAMFAARANETKRQLTALTELRDMYTGELQMLGARSEESSKEVTQTEEEVAALTKLVEKGITTVSRWSELRRVLVQMRGARTEDAISAMRARQSLSDTTRQEYGIHDQRQTEVASQLRDSQGDLARLKSREETVRRLLLADAGGTPEETRNGGTELRFAVVRQSQSGSAEVAASEATQLLPGDVLKVEVGTTLPGAVSTAERADVPAVSRSQ